MISLMNPTSTTQEWPTSTIIGLATLILMVVLAPIGWITRRCWIRLGQFNLVFVLQEMENDSGTATVSGIDGDGGDQGDIDHGGNESVLPLFRSGVSI